MWNLVIIYINLELIFYKFKITMYIYTSLHKYMLRGVHVKTAILVDNSA